MRTLIGVERLTDLLICDAKSWARKKVNIPPTLKQDRADLLLNLTALAVRPQLHALARFILQTATSANHSYAIVPSGEDDDREYILCLVCGMISANPNDVEHRYCGNCHLFHEDEKFVAPVV